MNQQKPVKIVLKNFVKLFDEIFTDSRRTQITEKNVLTENTAKKNHATFQPLSYWKTSLCSLVHKWVMRTTAAVRRALAHTVLFSVVLNIIRCWTQ